MLAGTLAGALILTVAACSPEEDEDSQEVPHHSFVSRPDLKPAQVEITQGEGWTSEYQDADEYILWTPNYGSETPSSGAKIFDLEGEPVWVAPDDPDDSEDNYFDLRVQQYRGEPVLTYYQGPSEGAGATVTSSSSTSRTRRSLRSPRQATSDRATPTSTTPPSPRTTRC